MSICDTCRLPGRCCTGFILSTTTRPETALEALVAMATVKHFDDPWMGGVGLPFLPFYRFLGADGQNNWRYWCPRLTRDGRCGDYENRPALCRSYEPKQDPLCAEYENEGKPT